MHSPNTMATQMNRFRLNSSHNKGYECGKTQIRRNQVVRKGREIEVWGEGGINYILV